MIQTHLEYAGPATTDSFDRIELPLGRYEIEDIQYREPDVGIMHECVIINVPGVDSPVQVSAADYDVFVDGQR